VSDRAALHNSFERLPANLKSGQFYPEFDDRIERKLKNLEVAGDTHVEILKTVSRHHGTPNGIFRWDGHTLDQIKQLLMSASPVALAHILRSMAQNYQTMKDGFPDLMLIKDGCVRFIEVKAGSDVIRRNQLTRIKQLRAAGFATDIARIEWVVDPNQIYVVVDVETTGGRPGSHRLTEIGAVKIQNGEIIGEWSTLLNPGRLIPANITALTGITNEMVATAPVFSEVVDEFSEFLGEAIFAAHNVGFDYKFIKAEFRLVDRPFNYPKICTVAGMRKFYPGYKSYSLKNLCREFDIDLTSHHRALCDAQAAAQLLMLINEQRIK
jgi:DNA polymerase-3 subunit epsilon